MLNNEGLRKFTLTGYRQTAERLKKALPGRLLSTLTAEELQQALAPPGTPQTMAETHIRRGKVFWNFAAENGWCKAETFARVKAPKNTAPAKEIEILTTADAENLLRAAEKYFPQAVASYALQLFAGIRVEEIIRLQAKHVSVEGIEITAEVSKKSRRRHINPNATLSAWLERYPFAPCPNWKRTDRACRYMAGFKLVPDPDLVKPNMIDLERERKPWPQNAMRHSHASYAVANGVSLETLLFEFGHSDDKPAVLRAHYVGRASKRDALAYYAISPEGEAPPN
jgi:site-specific recombinase XerD